MQAIKLTMVFKGFGKRDKQNLYTLKANLMKKAIIKAILGPVNFGHFR